MTTIRFSHFKFRVQALLKARHGITIDDCTDDNRLLTAFHASETPEDIVDWIASKYDLDRIDTGGW